MDQKVELRSGFLSRSYTPESPWALRARDAATVHLNFFGRRVKWAGSRALHVQCDYGLMADGMVRRGADVTAVDTRPDILDAAHARSTAGGYRVNYMEAQVDAPLPVDDESFDIVLCDHVFDRDINLPELLQDAQRVLRPNGLLLFTCLNASLRSRVSVNLAPGVFAPGLPPSLRPRKPRRPGRVRNALRAAGFEPQRFAGVGPRWINLQRVPSSYRVTRVTPVLYMGTALRL